MKTHTMRVKTEPFTRIKNGTKKIEGRILDLKRKSIEINDSIIFIHQMPDGAELESVTVAVLTLSYADSFSLLTEMHPIELFGWDNKQAYIDECMKHYSEEEMAHLGVVGIVFELIENQP